LLPRVYRLKSKHDFKKVYKYGRSYANIYLVIYVYKKKDNQKPRVGFSVSKKIGSAVVRNKIKRRMREVLRPLMGLLIKNVDIIFIARKKINGATYQDIKCSINKLLKKMSLI